MAAAHPARPGEQGETLIELMVAVLIMGTAIVAVLGALATMITTSDQHHGSTRAATAATTVAELIDNAPYVNCTSSYAAAYASPTFVAPTGFTVNVSVKWLVSRTTPTPAYNTNACTADKGVQQVTVKVTAPSAHGMSETVVLAKRRPA